MKYRWLKPTLSTKKRDIEQLLGVPVKEIRTGNISDDTNVSVQGIEIEVETELTPEQLEKLDTLYPELKRDGVNIVLTRLKELETRAIE